jgi:DNA processing protein
VLEHYDFDPMQAFFAPIGELCGIEGINAGDLEDLERRDAGRADEILAECDRQGISVVSMQDAAYPGRLTNIYAPPPVIYVKGHLPDVDGEAAIAVVGTRRATPYGIRMGRQLGYDITRCGGLVVSGLTAGVDAAGAEGALRAGGGCVGVLGTPHECLSSRLADDVAAVGALVSEYPPGTKPQNGFFRARNRITAGLSVGVVVVEAPEKSGTRLFAAEAAEQGKELFAVPGNADAESCAGSNAILKEGAKPVTDGWEIMCEFEGLFPGKLHRPARAGEPPVFSDRTESTDITGQNAPGREISSKKVIDNKNSSDYIDLQTQLKELSPEQLSIAAAITAPGTHVDDIIERTGLSVARVLAGLTMMQLRGIVRQEGGKRFSLNIKVK